jgi:hypothetical protein
MKDLDLECEFTGTHTLEMSWKCKYTNNKQQLNHCCLE